MPAVEGTCGEKWKAYIGSADSQFCWNNLLQFKNNKYEIVCSEKNYYFGNNISLIWSVDVFFFFFFYQVKQEFLLKNLSSQGRIFVKK